MSKSYPAGQILAFAQSSSNRPTSPENRPIHQAGQRHDPEHDRDHDDDYDHRDDGGNLIAITGKSSMSSISSSKRTGGSGSSITMPPVNPRWAKLVLSNRYNWTRVRFENGGPK